MSAASVALFNRWRDLMRSWGHVVVEVAGCDTRSASGRAYDPTRLFVEHHDASTKLSGLWGALAVITNGRPGIPGPLGNLQYARDGQVAIVAKNPANHAGIGGPLLGVPVNDANVNSCGAEVANDGLGEPYDPRLTAAIIDGEAAWAIVSGRTAAYVVGHREWAGPRKSDPRLDMNTRRAAVAARIRQHLDGGFLMALTDAQQAEMYDRLAKLHALFEWWIVPDDDPATPQNEATPNSKGELGKRVRGGSLGIASLLAGSGKTADVADVVAETIRQIGAGTVVPEIVGRLTPEDLQAFATALADEQDRRVRDGDPATGPVS